jgi:hypothetical protein
MRDTRVRTEPRPRSWAIVSDGPVDESAIAILAGGQAEGLAAVMVPPTCYELTRSCLPASVVCVTHPAELESLGVRRCVEFNAPSIISRHGVALRRFAEMVCVGAEPAQQPLEIRPSNRVA